jgi:hypothetical protein
VSAPPRKIDAAMDGAAIGGMKLPMNAAALRYGRPSSASFMNKEVVVSAEYGRAYYAHRLKKPLPNLTIHNTRVPDKEIRRLRNVCGVHLCTSETEGWGHYLVEGMTAKALVS